MAKVRLTKNELKARREGLKRFQRFLPTLQLKKQQLTLEVSRAREALAALAHEEQAYRGELAQWSAVLAAAAEGLLPPFLAVAAWECGVRNIAGIDVPLFEKLAFAEPEVDLFATDPWLDDAVAAGRRLVESELRSEVLREQVRLLEQELRVTTQRVNLFEKVKIPEAAQAIRKIQIYLGDQQTGAVGRAKIAKGKCEARDSAALALPAAVGQ
ncbi:MAG: V-type ATP synthase subunit D [Lentisphaeria bacterium]|jgi:V/A-type H+-transporting ATPase subunit D